MNFKKDQDYCANVNVNEKALIIQTRSGLGLTMIDHLYPPYILPLDADDKTLGKIILQALANSRTFVYGNAEYKDFFDDEKSDERYNAWVMYLCEQLGYKTKRALFKNMMNCSILLKNERIKIISSRHVRLEAWEGMRNVEDVILSLDNTPEEIGAGLRLALSRCR